MFLLLYIRLMKVIFHMVENVFYPKNYGFLGVTGNNSPPGPFAAKKIAQSDEDVGLFSASNKYTQNDSVSEYSQVKDIMRREKEREYAKILIKPEYNHSKPMPKKSEEEGLVTSCALKTFSPYRRIASIPNEINQGQILTALGAATVAGVNLPEDLRDVKNSVNQIKAFFKGEKYVGKYDYKTLQHPFSFFRGTLLHRFVNPARYKNPRHQEIAKKILESDTTLAQTGFGKWLIKLFGSERTDSINTEIKAIGYTEAKPKFVRARVYEGTKFGVLTAHACERTTKWGLVITALLEAPQIIKGFCHGDDILEKSENGTIQVLKSAMNVVLTTIGMSYIGAMGNKYGPLFSLAGMAVGAVIVGYGSRKIQESNG